MHWCVSHCWPIWRGLLRKTGKKKKTKQRLPSRLTHISGAEAQGALALRGQGWMCPPSPGGSGSALFLTAFAFRVDRPPPVQGIPSCHSDWIPTLPPSCLSVEALALEANTCPSCFHHSPTQTSFVLKPDNHLPIISVHQEARWSGFLGKSPVFGLGGLPMENKNLTGQLTASCFPSCSTHCTGRSGGEQLPVYFHVSGLELLEGQSLTSCIP